MGDEVREFLAGRDARCPSCGYNLRGVVGEVCPECGAGLSLRRLRADEEHRAWRERRMGKDPITTAGLLGSILGLGLPGAMLTLGLMMRGEPGFPIHRVWMMGGVFFVQVVLTAMHLGGLVRQSWPRRGKWWLAMMTWCWGPVMMVAIMVLA